MTETKSLDGRESRESDAKLDAAITEYLRWGTGSDSRRPRDRMFWAGREDEPLVWTEVSSHRTYQEAEDARFRLAMSAAIKAATSA